MLSRCRCRKNAKFVRVPRSDNSNASVCMFFIDNVVYIQQVQCLKKLSHNLVTAEQHKRYLITEHLLIKKDTHKHAKKKKHCFGSGSARIRIKKCLLDPDPDPGDEKA